MSSIAGLLLAPGGPRLLYVLAHGAGAGMRHPFLEAVARVREAVAEAARERPGHLEHVDVPMLFLQGTRDDFARLDLLRPLVERLPTATLRVVDGGDHSFKVKGRAAAEVIRELADALAVWADRALGT